MMKYYVLLILVLLIGLNKEELYAGNRKDSLSSNKLFQHTIFLGVTKSNYFITRAPSVFSDFKKSIDNTYPSYSLDYEAMVKLYKSINLGLGFGYCISKFQFNYSDFMNPNLLNGIISFPVRHEYLSIPIHAYWKLPISCNSSMLLYSGVESFKTTVFKQVEKEAVFVYRNNGSLDNSANIMSQFKTEDFSLFRAIHVGVRFQFNQRLKNRVVLGVNYCLMRNAFPLEVNSMIYAGNKNYEASSHLYFEGLKCQIGYFWYL